jgi:hypothetical protein
LAIAIVVSGCGQGSPAMPTQSYFQAPQTVASPATHFFGNDWMYSSQPGGNEVVIYKRRKDHFTLRRFETLKSGFSSPMGMTSTPGGAWYIANSGASNVLVYHSTRFEGPQGPKATLGDAGEVPVNVAVTHDQDLVAVSNGSTTGGGAGSVSVYLNRQVEPSHVLTYGKDPIRGEGIAIDSRGNCYWSFNDPKKLTGSIVEFAGCDGSGTLLRSGILSAGGLAFDRRGNLYYVDQILGIFKCHGTASCNLFTPVGLSGLIVPTNINFDNDRTQNLWVTDTAGYIDAVNLKGLISYILGILGGVTNPPIGVAPAPGS